MNNGYQAFAFRGICNSQCDNDVYNQTIFILEGDKIQVIVIANAS